MPPVLPLFTVPIEPTGRFICTQPSPKIYLLTFDSPPDNRLIPAFCKSFLLALDILDHRFPKGVLVTTSGIPKFYSNGLDYESAIKTKNFFSDSLYPLWRKLLTYVILCGLSWMCLGDPYVFTILIPFSLLHQLFNAYHRFNERSCICSWIHDCNDARLSLHEPSPRLPLP